MSLRKTYGELILENSTSEMAGLLSMAWLDHHAVGFGRTGVDWLYSKLLIFKNDEEISQHTITKWPKKIFLISIYEVLKGLILHLYQWIRGVAYFRVVKIPLIFRQHNQNYYISLLTSQINYFIFNHQNQIRIELNE